MPDPDRGLRQELGGRVVGGEVEREGEQPRPHQHEREDRDGALDGAQTAESLADGPAPDRGAEDARPQHQEGHGERDHGDPERRVPAEPRGERLAVPARRPSIRQEQRGRQAEGVFLGAERDEGRQQHEQRPADPADPVRRGAHGPSVGHERQGRGEIRRRRQQLRPADDVGDRLDVHRMHGEPQSGHDGARSQHRAAEPEHQRHDRQVQEDVRRVERERPAATHRPVDGEGRERRRAVDAVADILGPVRAGEERGKAVERVQGAVRHDDGHVVVDEAVAERRHRCGQGNGEHESVRLSGRHAGRYLWP